MAKDEKKGGSFEAFRNTRTGAIVLATDANRKRLGSRRDMVSTVATRGEDGRFVDANSSETVGQVSAGGDLQRIGNLLETLDQQRAQLVKAARRLPGGDEFLETLDLDLDVEGVDAEPREVQASAILVGVQDVDPKDLEKDGGARRNRQTRQSGKGEPVKAGEKGADKNPKGD